MTVVQLLVSVKSPVGVTPDTTRLAVPQFVTVIGTGLDVEPTGRFPKLTLVVLRQTAGAVTTPVPVTVAVTGFVAEEFVILRSADRAPLVVGLN
jgi:hypothetical protein